MKSNKGEILKGALLLITIGLWVLVAVCAVIIAIVNPGSLPDSPLLTLIGIETLAALALIACCCMIVNIARGRRHEE